MSEIRLHGRGGQGVVVAAEVMSNAMMRQGKYCSVFPSFGIERRGTAVIAFARVADQPVREKSKCYHPDILIVLDPSLLSKKETYEGFRSGGTIVACGTEIEEILASGVKPGKIIMADGLKIAHETIKKNITNMIILGTLARATDLVKLEDLQAAMVTGLGPAMAKKNEAAMRRGYDEAVVHDFDNVEKEEKPRPLFLEHITSCKAPPKPAYEAPWSDTKDNRYQVVPTGTWRFQRPVVEKEKCVKCSICATYCPIQCIKPDSEGYFIANYDYCKGCGVCANECPKDAISMRMEEK